jgi:hypothetical protein
MRDIIMTPLLTQTSTNQVSTSYDNQQELLGKANTMSLAVKLCAEELNKSQAGKLAIQSGDTDEEEDEENRKEKEEDDDEAGISIEDEAFLAEKYSFLVTKLIFRNAILGNRSAYEHLEVGSFIDFPNPPVEDFATHVVDAQKKKLPHTHVQSGLGES